MKNRTIILAIIFAPFSFLAAATPAQTTVFTYQGKLQNSSAPANGNFDFEFLLFDAAGGGSQVGSTIPRNGVSVADGVFSANLDFGASFPGSSRFLETHVRQSGGGAFTTLTPRQFIASAPYSITSLNAANAVNATTATNALSLGGVAANQYLQTNGSGSGLTNLNAANIATGTLNNTRLGLIPTANIADSAVTSPKIAAGQVVKGLTVGAATLTDNVNLVGSSNITITPSGNTVTIASTGGGVGGSGATNSIPLWSAGTTLGNSLITQSVNGIQLPNGVQLAAGAQGNQLNFGSPNGETGLSISGAIGRADVRFDGTTLKLIAGPAGGPPSVTNGVAVTTSGNVGIGTSTPTLGKLQVNANSFNAAIYASNIGAGGIGVRGESVGAFGVAGFASGNQSAGVYGFNISPNAYAGRFEGRVIVSGDLIVTGDITFPGLLEDNSPGIGERLSVFGKAIKDQQEQIKQQQRQIDALTKLVCASNPKADICRER